MVGSQCQVKINTKVPGNVFLTCQCLFIVIHLAMANKYFANIYELFLAHINYEVEKYSKENKMRKLNKILPLGGCFGYNDFMRYYIKANLQLF